MSTPRILTLSLAILLVAGASSAATFVVPSDRNFVHRADAIIVGSALVSYSQPGTAAAIETVTSISVEEVIKGSRIGGTIDVVEPGGVFGGQAMIIAGVPQFTPGDRVLLFLNRTPDGRWAATDLLLGKFAFKTEGAQTLLQRDEDDLVGWDANMQPHREPRRAAAAFLQFVRDEAHGRMPKIEYVTEAPAQTSNDATSTTSRSSRFVVEPSFIAEALAFSATSYTMVIAGSNGARWNVFPNAVNWYMGTTQEPGAPGGGANAIQSGIAAWDNDAGSNVNYVYAGVDNGTHTQGLHASDGANTVLFERDLSAWGVSPFACSGSSYGGTLGMGGVTSTSGTHAGPNGETFYTTKEGDVEMNKGIANCSLLLNGGDWNSAVAHELGHTLGFRHSDQDRNGAACTASSGVECSSSAIMTASITHNINATLQQWDINAVRAVYPGTTPPPPGGGLPPARAVYDGDARADAAVWRPSNATWYVARSSGGFASAQWGLPTDKPVPGKYDADAIPDMAVFRPSTAIWYINGSAGTNMVVQWGLTGDVPVPADYDGDGRTDIAVWRPSNGTWYIRTSSTGAMIGQQWGYSTDIPVAADYDGDGRADIAVWRPGEGNWYIRQTSAGNVVKQWGLPGDSPVPADYDGDRRADLAVWRPNDGNWWLNQSAAGVAVIQWGLPGDIPLPADYNGDGRADTAVWRPSTAVWWERYSGSGQVQGFRFGQTGDTPAPR